MDIGIFLCAVFISSVSQILLKQSADKQYISKIREYLNFRVLLAYAMFFGASLITVLAYRTVPLSLGPVLESVGYIFVTVLGYFVLNEKMSQHRCVGLITILIGVWISSI